LRSLIDHRRTGFLIEGRDPLGYVAAVELLFADSAHAAEMGAAATSASLRYTWSMTAARLRRLYGDLEARELVQCGGGDGQRPRRPRFEGGRRVRPARHTPRGPGCGAGVRASGGARSGP